ncbi:VanZ family protein [Neobacillus sp. PS3-40]|uniref:VanZ family protein n=1 Tax=Neobacillus sp. PS3-40 TaxID=3070679 RepID=UPI0027DF4D13|nr:VanZ family protein [Neobacillus sp. PS3-40]WML44587.1 VanZ family protein [Neobacillus sp. PS3-40]
MRFNGDIVIVFGFICYIVVRVIILALKRKHKRPLVLFKELIRFLFVLYILMVISVTLFPLEIGVPHEKFTNRFLNYIPLISILGDINQVGTAYSGDSLFMIKIIVKNEGGNILMLMPLGFLMPILWRKFKGLKYTIMIGLFVSLCVECLQFVELQLGLGMTRTVDIDDVICNVLGTFFGLSFK